MTAAQQLLDQVQSIARIEALEVDPATYAERLADELGRASALSELEARDGRLRDALAQLDAMIERAARIRLDHALAHDTTIAAPTRKVFATTIVGYDGRIELLEARARDAAVRGGAMAPDDVAGAVAAVARSVLALRAAMRGSVLALVADRAAAVVAGAHALARDRRLDDATRTRWSAMRRELQAIEHEPARIGSAPMAARLATWPAQLDEPDPEREPTFAELLELD